MSYFIEIRHEDLGKYRLIKGNDMHVVRQKANAQLYVWSEQWAKKESQIRRKQTADRNLERAEELTNSAHEELESLRGTLRHTLGVNDVIDWDSLKDTRSYSVSQPVSPPPVEIPRKPTLQDAKYRVDAGFLGMIIPPLRRKREDQSKVFFDSDYRAWQDEARRRITQNKEEKAAYELELANWKQARAAFTQQQKESHDAIEAQRSAYWKGDVSAIEDYCDMVLSRSEYPDTFPQDFELKFIQSSKTLIVDYSLPAPDVMPRVKEVRYIKSRDELQEISLKDAERDKLYDEVVYQITLRTIHECFEADVIEAIDAVVFNGWVSSVDKTTGNIAHACIVSVQAKRAEFLSLNLAQVDPKACFKRLKGVGSSLLHSVTPVPPVMSLNTQDKRFVSSYAVAEGLSSGSNLASMDWEDFEHLVREVFEKEFASGGAEVKVTRASRDGGVDAVVFDPDPIRGGKTVIQAKRYVNTVGVSAVRDLFGTVMNEGAMKGILVTTADYGPDAYEFVRNKPLTLISGAQLLFLLDKHGHKARIDLEEARKLDQLGRQG